MRIIGIDLGSHSVKAVELDSAFGRFEIHEYHEVKVESDMTPADAAKKLIAGLHKKPDRIAVTLRTDQTTFRNLKFPTKDRKVIHDSLPFELDDELPFSIETAVYDSVQVEQGTEGTTLHVAITLQKVMAQFIDELIERDIDPDLVTTEPWAYRTLLNRVFKNNPAPELQTDPILMIQVGHKSTTLYLHQKDRPIFAKEIRWGGHDFTNAIAKVYGVSNEKAELTKHDHAFLLTDSEKSKATADQITFSETLKGPFEELLNEIRMTNLASKKETGKRISRMYISGGGSLIPGFANTLTEIFQVPVESLKCLTQIQTGGPAYSEYADSVFSLATGAAIALASTGKNNSITLRKGDFSKAGSGGIDLNLAALRKPLIAAVCVMVCFFLSLIVRSFSIETKTQDANAQLKKSIKGFFSSAPSESAIKNYINSPSLLKKTIEKELEKERTIQRLFAENTQSPLLYLKTLSQSIPESVVVDLVRYQVGAAPDKPFSTDLPQDATLSFLVRKKETIDPLKKILESKMDQLVQGEPEEIIFDGGPKPKMKHLKTTFVGKPKGMNNGHTSNL